MLKRIEQNLLLTGTGFLKQRDYWLNKLAGIRLKAGAPLDFAIKTGQGTDSEPNRLDLLFPGSLAARLMKLGKDSDISLYIILLAGLKTLIYKYTGCRDILVVSPLNKLKVSQETMNHILFIRDQVAGDMTFKELLLEIRESVLGAYENQDYPFDILVEFPGYDVLRHNIKENSHVSFSLKNLHEENNIETLKGNISFAFERENQVIRGQIEFAAGTCEKAYAEQMPGHFTRILEQAAANVTLKLTDISIFSEGEKQRLLLEFNDTRCDYPVDLTIHRLYDEQAGRTPDRIALVGVEGAAKKGRSEEEKSEENPFGPIDAGAGMHLSYGELKERSGKLAGVLIEKGVRFDTIVGIRMERSLEMIIGIMGILKSAGAYMPIDPEDPKNRSDYMLKDSAAKILLTANEIVSPSTGCVVTAGVFPNPSAGRPLNYHHSSFIAHRSSNLAYLIYTSGSTGKPKGVMVEHRNVIRLVKNTNYIDFKSGDRILQTGALEFDASTFEIWGALANGLILYLGSKENILNPGKLGNIITDNHITVMWLTSQLFNHMVQVDVDIFAGLRHILVGGDVLSPSHIDQTRRRFPRLLITNGYGPTENTTFSTTFAITNEYREKIPIGKPIANSRAYIVDGAGNLQPPGIAGEIWVGGDGVSRGYMNNPELTCEKFGQDLWDNPNYLDEKEKEKKKGTGQNNPLPILLRAKLYKTGDLGRWLPDGNIEFLGRKDNQVKIRGYRIELGEIETLLLTYPTIKEAVVINKTLDHGNQCLCAYVVEQGGSEPGKVFDSTELKEYLAKKLPAYMIPSFFVPMDGLPLTPGGKIARQALPGPEAAPGEEYMAPRDEKERRLAEIWSEVLGIEAGLIGIDTNFFRLGGHSLTTTILAAMIHKEFDVEISVGVIFEKPYIRGLARYLAGALKKPFTPLNPGEKKEYYPLSSSQGSLYVEQLMELESTGYNMPMAVVLEGKLDRRKLENTFRMLIARHESLRTSFQAWNDEPVQKVYDHVEFDLDFHEFDHDTADFHENHDFIKQFIRPFDLSQAPLLRVRLIKVGKEKHILQIDTHHIISDGVSHHILIGDFMRLYGGEKLVPLRLGYKDFSQGQNNLVKSGEIKKQEEYWLSVFPGKITRINLPTDFARPAVRDFKGDSLGFEISGEIKRKLDELVQAEEVTMYMALLAVFNVLLAKLSGLDDIIVGTVFAGRRHIDLEKIIGVFVNMVVMRNFPTREKTFRDFLRELKTRAEQASENQAYPFNLLVEKLVKKREPGQNPLLDIGFGFHDREPNVPEIPSLKKFGLTLKPYEVENKISKFDLTFHGVNVGDRISFVIEYWVRLFKKETIMAFSKYFKRVLREVLNEPDKKIKEIEIIPQAEKAKVLAKIKTKQEMHPIEFNI